MVTKSQHKRIDACTDNFITAVMKSLMMDKLNRQMAYWRYKRIHAKKYGYAWRRSNRGIAATRQHIEEVLDPMWCKTK